MMRRLRGQSDLTLSVPGATLIEVVVALAIAAVAVAAVYGFILSAVRSYTVVQDLLDVQQTVRFIIDRIVEEARWADHVLPDARCRPVFLCSDRVTLHIPAGNPLRPDVEYAVAFRYDARTMTVVRQQGREEQIIGDSVTTFSIRFLTSADKVAPGPQHAARIHIEVTGLRASAGVPARETVQTDVLLRNFRPPTDPVAPVITAPQREAWRPIPVPPVRLRRSPHVRPGDESTPAVATGPVCPSAPDALPRLAPPRPEVPDARVEITDWDISLVDGTVVVEGKVENREAEDIRAVRISATGYSSGGTATTSASTTLTTIAAEDTEVFTLRLTGSVPLVWILLKVEQYLPRSVAPLYEALADVPLSIYQDEAREHVQVTATVLPVGQSSRHTVCLIMTDFAGLPVDWARVKAEVMAPGQPAVTEMLDVRAGRTTSFQVIWRSAVPATATATVQGVRFIEGQGSPPR